MSHPKHWSYSSLSVWMECPKRFKFQYTGDVPAKITSPAMERGNRIHEALELSVPRFVTGEADKISVPLADLKWTDEDAAYWRDRFAALRRFGKTVVAEGKWDFDEDWNDPQVTKQPRWATMKLDLSWQEKKSVLDVVDYKTGKVYPQKHRQQGEVYAIGALARNENLKSVRMAFWYLDQRHVEVETYTPDKIKMLAKRWRRRAEEMLADRQYKPTPGFHCRFCPLKDHCPDAAT